MMVVVGCHQPLSIARLKGRHPMDLVVPRGSGCKLACSSLQSAGVVDPMDRHPDSLMAYGTAWNEAYIMLVSCIDYALDMTCIQSVSQCFIVGGIL